MRGRSLSAGRYNGRFNAAPSLWRDRIGLILALLAFFSQTLALPLHNMGAVDPTQRAAVELRQIFGDAFVLCVQADDAKGPAAPLDHSDDHCPLCQAGAGALAIVLPTPFAEPVRFAAVAEWLAPEASATTREGRSRLAAQPRGPPAQA